MEVGAVRTTGEVQKEVWLGKSAEGKLGLPKSCRAANGRETARQWRSALMNVAGVSKLPYPYNMSLHLKYYLGALRLR